MAYSYYNYLILVSSESNINSENLHKACEKLLTMGCKNIETHDESFMLEFAEKYKFYLKLNRETYVAEESAEIARQDFVVDEKKENIASCKSRYEMSADADPNMDYFNESLFIIEIFEKFPGVFIFDPNSGDFL